MKLLACPGVRNCGRAALAVSRPIVRRVMARGLVGRGNRPSYRFYRIVPVPLPLAYLQVYVAARSYQDQHEPRDRHHEQQSSTIFAMYVETLSRSQIQVNSLTALLYDGRAQFTSRLSPPGISACLESGR